MVIKETENDDLTNVMQELIETYADQMGDVAISLCQELVCVVNYLLAAVSGQPTHPCPHSINTENFLRGNFFCVRIAINKENFVDFNFFGV